MDPFATLGIARSFDVDLPAVERVHRDLSRALHPDRYVGASASERRQALTKAVEVNEAWRVVRDPIRRAEALFTLAGVPVGEDREPKPGADLLMEMLELREALAEARASRDVPAVRGVAEGVQRRQAEVLAALSRGFAAGEGESLVPSLGELRFLRRLLDEASAIEDELAA
jgi:molecular chaperone HscB